MKNQLKLLIMLFGLLPAVLSAAQLKVGDDAPDFQATNLSGENIKLSTFKGKKPVYLKFWATWCSYCKVEMPHLQAIYDENGAEIEVLTVNVAINDSIANIDKFYRKQGFDLPTVFDQEGALTSSYGVVGTPYHVLIDKQGKIAYLTFLATDELDKRIAQLSEEKIALQDSTRATANKVK